MYAPATGVHPQFQDAAQTAPPQRQAQTDHDRQEGTPRPGIRRGNASVAQESAVARRRAESHRPLGGPATDGQPPQTGNCGQRWACCLHSRCLTVRALHPRRFRSQRSNLGCVRQLTSRRAGRTASSKRRPPRWRPYLTRSSGLHSVSARYRLPAYLIPNSSAGNRTRMIHEPGKQSGNNQLSKISGRGAK
jgi:hypothetical protein